MNLVAGTSYAGIAFSASNAPEGSSQSGNKPQAGGTYRSEQGPCPLSSVSTVTVPLTVRSVSDPVVKAAEATSYSFDFGNTQAENAATGGTLLTVGMILTGIPILCMVGIAKMLGSRRSTQSSSAVAMYAQGGATAMPMPMQQQPQMMGQPQMTGSVPGGYAPPQMVGIPPVAAAANPVYGGIPGVGQSPFPTSAPMGGKAMVAAYPQMTVQPVAMPMVATAT